MNERKIDPYSYQLGVIDCFNEMVAAGVKRIALSHPCREKAERDELLNACREICGQYGTHYYSEDDSLVTDLFPEQMNRGMCHYIFYREQRELDCYLELKERKAKLEAAGEYQGEARYRLAWDFGKLLSYTDEAVERMICETTGTDGSAG